MRSKFGGTPCFHIKDDTMIYRGALGSPINPFKTLPAVSDPEPSAGSYSPSEPFYEVPKYGDDDPKSSSASSGSKYSSSGYVGSELWESDYFNVSNQSQSPAHCYVNPSSQPGAVHSRTLQMSYGGSPQSSTSGLGSGSGSSTVSNGSGRMFFSPAHHGTARGGNMRPSQHQTLMWVHGGSPQQAKPPVQQQPQPQHLPLDKYSTASYRNDLLSNDENLMDTNAPFLAGSHQHQHQPRTMTLFSTPTRSVRSPKQNRQLRPNAFI